MYVPIGGLGAALHTFLAPSPGLAWEVSYQNHSNLKTQRRLCDPAVPPCGGYKLLQCNKTRLSRD
jgi:hypothetical protein